MNEKETDEFVKMVSFIAEEEAKTLTIDEIKIMVIHGCDAWIDKPIEEVRKRYNELRGSE
tara:strand:+ start:280 stop:459 length:180 start_codon:yes stop_codon:yes gene_type:complete